MQASCSERSCLKIRTMKNSVWISSSASMRMESTWALIANGWREIWAKKPDENPRLPGTRTSGMMARAATIPEVCSWAGESQRRSSEARQVQVRSSFRAGEYGILP